jgi:phenylacetate-CoA ligase
MCSLDGYVITVTNKSILEHIYNTLEDSQWWPKDHFIETQRVELTRLVGHARSTSPFYKTRLDCLFRPNGTIDWDRWSDIPIITRSELSFQRLSIQSTNPIQSHGPFGLVKTSGSTGDPVQLLVTRLMNDMSVAALWRGQKWANMDWSSAMIHMAVESPNWKLGDVMGPWGPPWLKDAAKGRRIFATYSTKPADRVALIKKYNADYVAFTGGLAVAFADHVRATAADVKLKTVQFIGSSASEYVRKDFRKLLNADVVELYSSKEGGTIASPCPLGHGWHQNAESVLVEIVDDYGKPVAPGETGRVIITPFGNTATPLIRYDQGDLAVAGPVETCPCGRTLPRIASFSGRYRHMFKRPNGEVVPDLSVDARINLGAGVWQVARIAEHSFEVRYKKRDWGIPINIAEFHRLFAFEFYPEATVKLIEVDDFVMGPTGKHIERLDEWDPNSQEGI